MRRPQIECNDCDDSNIKKVISILKDNEGNEKYTEILQRARSLQEKK